MSNTQPLTSLSQIKFELIGHVAVLTMSNPPVNPMSRILGDELTFALDYISEIDDVRAVVLIGEGKIFCAGADLKGRADIIKGPGDLPAHARRTREAFHAIRECTKPVIAAINGPALGAGLGMAASADVLICSENASLGLPEIDVGLLGGCRHAQRLFSHSFLRMMAFTGYRVPAAELYRLGVVFKVTAQAELLDEAVALATKIASKSPLSIRLSKRTMNAIEDMSLRDGYRYEQDMTAAIAQTQDAKEAQSAFLEKRDPKFLGR